MRTTTSRGSRKILVVGLDGATFRLIDPWVQAGKLPTFAKVLREGVRGNLRSTIRPESSIAWTSFATGKNPGKHGVFGFAAHKENSYSTGIISARSIRSSKLWNIVGGYGKKVIVLNVPVTYPPEPVNGFLVSGILTPSLKSRFTFPESLSQELLTALGDYVITVDKIDDKETFVNRVRYCTEKRKEAALYLMNKYEWDLFTIVFTGLDRLQHFLWADMDPSHPRHDPQSAVRYGTTLLEYHQCLDEILAEILGHLEDNTVVMIVSDHGFNGFYKTVHLNAWLRDNGFLAFRRDSYGRIAPFHLLLRLPSFPGVGRVKRALPFLRKVRVSTRSLTSLRFERLIDWSKTKAFCSKVGGIRINVEGREPEGVVKSGTEYESLRESLQEALMTVKDPETGAPVFEAVYKREELYWGPYVNRAPDLIVEPRRDDDDCQRNYALACGLPTKHQGFLDLSNPRTGNHTLDGVFIAFGEGIRRGVEIKEVGIMDLTPTILYAMGLSVPDDIDGKTLQDIFDYPHHLKS